MDGNQFFRITNQGFFKPLSGKYKSKILDCILRIYDICKNEFAYEAEKNRILANLQDYFDRDDEEMSFEDDKTVARNSKDKASSVLRQLKANGWIDEEMRANHISFVQLNDFAIPFIENICSIIRTEETEYQGIVSRIAILLKGVRNDPKPYENILLGVKKYVDELVSELKRLNSSIKRKIDELTRQASFKDVLDTFESYNSSIVSKSYYRLKTSDNIAKYRSGIFLDLDGVIYDSDTMKKAIVGYIEVNTTKENVVDEENAKGEIIQIIHEIRNDFKRLDDIIDAIDEKNKLYIRSALNRARFWLSTGENTQGKINVILQTIAKEEDDFETENVLLVNKIFALNPIRYVSNDSLRTIPVFKKRGQIESIESLNSIDEKTKQAGVDRIRRMQKSQYSNKSINEYVKKILGDKKCINVKEIPITSESDFIRIIYIAVFASNLLSVYRIRNIGEYISIDDKYEFRSFEIVRR